MLAKCEGAKAPLILNWIMVNIVAQSVKLITLYKKAAVKVDGKNVELIQGDSGEELASLVTSLKGPALFWLDGHYSGGDTARGEEDTPIYKELGHILGCGETGHVIIIDDAHLFGVDPSYPTMEELEEFVISKNGGVEIYQRDNMIRVVPKG